MGVHVAPTPSYMRLVWGCKEHQIVAHLSYQIDWLSIVHSVYSVGEGSEPEAIGEVVFRTIHRAYTERLAEHLTSDVRPLDYGRAPYKVGWSNDNGGVKFWASDLMPHFTIEISGRGMADLYETGNENALLLATADLVSRIDLAVDIEGGWSPAQIIDLRQEGREKTFSEFNSGSGVSFYVGSRKSERYSRVYRYNEPHPRSHLTRVEMVFRRDHAKRVANQILEHGLEAVCKKALLDFGWPMLVDTGDWMQAVDLSTVRPERNMGGTTRWLITQCAPAFKRLVKEGIITDPEQFLLSYFLSDIEEQKQNKID